MRTAQWNNKIKLTKIQLLFLTNNIVKIVVFEYLILLIIRVTLYFKVFLLHTLHVLTIIITINCA